MKRSRNRRKGAHRSYGHAACRGGIRPTAGAASATDRICGSPGAYFSSMSKTIWDGTRPGRKKFNAPPHELQAAGFHVNPVLPASRPRLSRAMARVSRLSAFWASSMRFRVYHRPRCQSVDPSWLTLPAMPADITFSVPEPRSRRSHLRNTWSAIGFRQQARSGALLSDL
jgi:hypothetical protein